MVATNPNEGKCHQGECNTCHFYSALDMCILIMKWLIVKLTYNNHVGGILDIAMAGTSATLLACKWESALRVNGDNDTLRRILDNHQTGAGPVPGSHRPESRRFPPACAAQDVLYQEDESSRLRLPALRSRIPALHGH